MKINLRAMMLASGLMIGMIPFMPGEANAEEVSVPDSRKLSDITYMQDMNPYICENSAENESKQLIDTRDGKSYWVTKLKDGNCWMTQNLDLDIPASGLSANDTDIPVDWNSGSTYKPEATQTTASPNFGTTNNNIKSWDPAQGGAEKYCVDSKCNSTSVTSSNNGHDAQGNYYSWGAATAGQAATFGTSDSTTYPANATQSICPKGWTLPTSGGNNGQYYTLLDGLGVAQITTSPYYFIYGGLVNNSSLGGAGNNGQYWSSTAMGQTTAYNLGFATTVGPSSNRSRSLGNSVRCVARPKRTISDLTYMQDMTTSVCEKSSENETKQLIDQRDGKTYWVAKLKDSNCWMTQNLAYDDEASSFSIPSSWGTNSTARKYYNPGLYVYTTPTTQNNCGTSGIDSLDACTSKGWVNVAGWTPSDDPNYTSIADATNKIYDTHYLSGNYYSYVSATAGSGESIISGNASNSICPTGWQLPTSNSTTASKSFGYLLTQYDVNSSLTKGNYDIRLAPLYFVYSGIVSENSNSLNDAGRYGFYRSSMVYSNNLSYDLRIDTSVNSSSLSGRYDGFSVRCVSRADVPDNNDNVTITITPTLSLDVAATTEIPYTAGGISTGSLSATVKSNQQHALQLSAAQPNLVNEADNSKIIPADAGVSAGTSAWGIKKKQSAESTPLGSTTDVSAYTALTSTPDIFYRSAAGSEGTASIDFTVGISTDSSVASGTYSTNVTVTATTI